MEGGCYLDFFVFLMGFIRNIFIRKIIIGEVKVVILNNSFSFFLKRLEKRVLYFFF